MAKKDGTGFEENLKEIETIVDSLESGDLDLDKAMEHYERGMALIKTCRALLKDSKIKIELLKKRTEEGYEAEVLEAGDEDAAAGEDDKPKKKKKSKDSDKDGLF